MELNNEVDDDDDGHVHTDSESLEKRCKYDPLAEFCNLSSLKPHSATSFKDQTAEVDGKDKALHGNQWSNSQAPICCKKYI